MRREAEAEMFGFLLALFMTVVGIFSYLHPVYCMEINRFYFTFVKIHTDMNESHFFVFDIHYTGNFKIST